jgi:hypothetical protein
MNRLLLLALASLLAGCAMPSNHALFDIAQKTARERGAVPAGAEWLGFKKGEVFPCKNMTRVNVPYTYTADDGQRKTAYCTVWLKRVALRWEPDRCEPSKPQPPAPGVRVADPSKP